jgi:predicted nuclease with TOPRIM domain
VEISKANLEEVLLLGNELIEEKLKHCKQVELNVEMSKMIQCLEDESKHLKSNAAKAKTTLKVLQVKEAHLKDSTTHVLKENSQLQERCDQLLREAESWKEQVSELTKQKLKVEVSVAHAEQLVNAKEDHISSLTECLLKMKVWAAVVEAHMTHDVQIRRMSKKSHPWD